MDVKKPLKFSIITVCWNEAASIRQTCESVVSQTCSDFEWIVIDGQSTDGTLDILSEYRSRISCLVSEPDGGIYDAMNKGIQRATGEYLLFLNGGDSLMDSEVLTHVSQAPCKDIIFGDIVFMRHDGSTLIVGHPDVLPEYFLLKTTLPHQAAFIRRELFNQYGLYNTSLKIAGDFDLFVRFLYVHKVSYFHISRVLSIFREGGISNHPRSLHMQKKEYHEIRWTYFPKIVYLAKLLGREYKKIRRTYRKRQGNGNLVRG